MKNDLLFYQNIFLHCMRKVQTAPGDYVAVDLFTCSLSTPKDHSQSQKIKILSARWRPDLRNLLEMLEKKGCIEFIEEESETRVYNIVYDHTHEVQRVIAILISFLLRSIFVPIIVSVVTTLITLLLRS